MTKEGEEKVRKNRKKKQNINQETQSILIKIVYSLLHIYIYAHEMLSC